MQGRDFLEVARYLQTSDGEAYLRTRIGRAYYAAYLEARTYCEVHLDYSRTKSSREHQDVPKMIRDVDSFLADELAFLRSYRTTADYDLDISIDTIEANIVHAETKAVFVIAGLDALTDSRASETRQFPTIEPGP
ncbi:MAG: hypothetical protein ACR2OU_10845 [Thermomicrobiales bacterium]